MGEVLQFPTARAHFSDRYSPPTDGSLALAPEPENARTPVSRFNPISSTKVIEERTAPEGQSPTTATLDKSYTYGLDLISQTDHSTASPKTSYYLYDGHGTVRGLTDDLGHVTDEYDYDAFGILIREDGTTENAYLYAGEQWDADLGLYYLRARYLDVEDGRFMSVDPFDGVLGDPRSLHKYLYAHANPVMNIDPTGRMTAVELLQVGGIISILSVATIPNLRVGLKSVGRTIDSINLSRAFRFSVVDVLVAMASVGDLIDHARGKVESLAKEWQDLEDEINDALQSGQTGLAQLLQQQQAHIKALFDEAFQQYKGMLEWHKRNNNNQQQPFPPTIPQDPEDY